jgi:hypothetical protein
MTLQLTGKICFLAALHPGKWAAKFRPMVLNLGMYTYVSTPLPFPLV